MKLPLIGTHGCRHCRHCPDLPHTLPAAQYQDWATSALCQQKQNAGAALAGALAEGGVVAATAFNASLVQCPDGSFPWQQFADWINPPFLGDLAQLTE